MKRLKHSLAAAFGLLVLTAVIGLTLSPPTRAQIAEKIKTGVTSVLIVNGPSDPVPVAGTVNLGNDSENPLPVKNLGNPPIQPVHFDAQFEVPLGKRLVTEFISAEFSSTGPCSLLTVQLRVSPAGGGAPPLRHTYYPSFIGQSGSGEYFYGLSETIRAYVDEGETAVLGTSSTCANLNVSNRRVTGHLVDKQ
jgi:hypothetical protein